MNSARNPIRRPVLHSIDLSPWDSLNLGWERLLISERLEPRSICRDTNTVYNYMCKYNLMVTCTQQCTADSYGSPHWAIGVFAYWPHNICPSHCMAQPNSHAVILPTHAKAGPTQCTVILFIHSQAKSLLGFTQFACCYPFHTCSRCLYGPTQFIVMLSTHAHTIHVHSPTQSVTSHPRCPSLHCPTQFMSSHPLHMYMLRLYHPVILIAWPHPIHMAHICSHCWY